MSDFGGSNGRSGDEDVFDFASGLQCASPRPAKRRRLTDSREHSTERDSRSGTDVESDICADWPGSSSLPSQGLARRKGDSADEAQSGGDKPAASKYKIYEPKFRTDHEPTFVTQLTQPPSSPYRIRGARWKKPPRQVASPDPIPQPSMPEFDDVGDSQRQNNDSPYSNDDMRAAIEASMETFREEDTHFGVSNGMQNSRPQKRVSQSFQEAASSAVAACSVDTSFLDDLPEDAFDTSPDSSPKKGPGNSILISSQPSRSQPPQRLQTGPQHSMRQTTLLGGFASGQRSSSQTASRSWPLANQAQEEPPTHHHLNPEGLDCWVYPSNLGERRDYQFNITQRALYHNLLVALPTGLGKTFIAATVMLNWFRWTKEAQVVFVAPTKPLVAQQIDACFNIAGIPRSETTMLTGEIPPGIREEEWKTKRVFFMTPQTVINDLKTGIADPKRIVLLVVDEAHRATGAYAYSQVVHFLQRFNTSFRVLALTATPGSTVESVQEVIDNLNISRVEIRTEKSYDIREYVHSKQVETQTFENSEEMVVVMELFSKVLQPAVDKLNKQNAHWARDPMALTPYGLTVSRKKWMASPAGRNANPGVKGMVNAIFTLLASLAHSIDLLKYHGIGPFYRSVLSFESSAKAGKGKNARQIVDDKDFKSMMSSMRLWTNNDDFIGHPKLEHLRQVVLNHFLDAREAVGRTSGQSDTRVMIFAHFRDSAEEIARVLKRHEPLIKPRVFVGQANAKGSEGMNQKAQLEVVKHFKEGRYNTIVATSIGEEGLDIGEVDLIVCYDSSSSPIRMLQRMGRTGRKRQGKIVLLLMKGKEEDSYTRAKDNYEKMQEMIASGDRFNYHTDKSPRMLPREIQPYVDERVIEIPIENTQADLPEPKRRPGRAPKRAPKKFHMPDGVKTGFTTAASIGRPKKKSKISDFVREASPIDLDRQDPEGFSSGEKHTAIPHPNDIILTTSQKADLAEELRMVPENNTFLEPPRTDAFPSAQRRLRPTRFVRHGRTTRAMVNTLSAMAGMGSDCEDECRKNLRSDDASRYRSSPETSPEPRPRRRQQRRRRSHADTGKNDDVISVRSDDSIGSLSVPFSPLMCTQSSTGRALERELDRPQYDVDDDSDIPDPDTLFGRSLSDNQTHSSPSQRVQDEVIELDSDGDSTPQPTTQRRNRYVVSDDSDF